MIRSDKLHGLFKRPRLLRKKEQGDAAKIKIVFAFTAIYLIWGTTYLAIRFAIETIPPFFMMGCRFLLAGGILYGWARLRGQERPKIDQWMTSAAIGLLLFLGGHGSLAWSEQVLPSGIAALIVATTPLWMVLVARARNPAVRISRRVIFGLVLGFAGMVFLLEPSSLFGGKTVDIAGAAVLLFGNISWCIGSVYSKPAKLPKSLALASGMTMLCGGASLFLFGLLTGEGKKLASVSGLSASSLLYLVLFGSIIGFTAYMWLLKTVSPAQVSTYAFVNPIIAVFVGWFGGGEALSPRILMASGLMIAAVMAIVLRKPITFQPAKKNKSVKIIAFDTPLKED